MTQKKGAPMQLCICVAVIAAAVSLLSNVGPPRARRPLLADLQLLDGTAWRLTGRLQVSRGERELTAQINAAPGTVDRLSNASATFREVWRRAAENEWRDGSASENVLVSDEVFVSALARHRDAVDATLATGLLAWAAHIGAAGACRMLIELGADVSLRPARMLGRNALHVAASRSWRDAYNAIAAAADDSLALEKDLFGKTPADYWEARRTASGGTCEIESATALTSRELARAIYGGKPTIFRGAASNWSDAIEAWSPETLALVDDVIVEAHPIPHGEQSFGISAPRPPESLGAFVRRSFGDDVAAAACEGRCGPDDVSDLADYVFDTGDAADALVRNSSLMPRLLNILRPAPALDAALDGIPRWLHRRDAQDVVQVYIGPTGAGAPFHYHENALNALLHGRKRWWLKEPSEAVYSVRHPRAWCRRGVEVAFTPSTRRVIDRLRRRADDAKDACTFVQEAGDVVLVPANWAHAILNEAPVVGAAFEHLDAYLIASNSRRVFA
jgi:hypothetical protein